MCFDYLSEEIAVFYLSILMFALEIIFPDINPQIGVFTYTYEHRTVNPVATLKVGFQINISPVGIKHYIQERKAKA